MNLSDFDYNLPQELIAQKPAEPRDCSRLLVLERKDAGREAGIFDKHFYDLPDYLSSGDVLVLNNSKVFPARLIGKKASGGKLEVFLLSRLPRRGPTPLRGDGPRRTRVNFWQCLIGGRGAKAGVEIFFEKKLIGKIIKNNKDGTWDLEFNQGHDEMMKIVEEIGQTPLPPYIKAQDRKEKIDDKKRYQTVYANDSQIGSVAAPTAGLHFTPELMEELKKKGVEILYITLHVGLGTFAPVKTEDIEKHKMHAEYVEIESDVIKKIIKAKQEKRRIITVGTTSTRSLEAFFSKTDAHNPPPAAFSSFVDIFIYPGYKFKAIDGMITNFHLPKSTLLMLVSALAGKTDIDRAYKHAIKNQYRFYSYGDAMLII